MSLAWLTVEEERKLQKEFGERFLRWKSNYRPLDYDSGLNDNEPVTHPHKPRIERPRIPPITFVLLGLSAFWILVGMAVLNK